MVSVYETLLDNIQVKLLKDNRTNAELSDKLFETFEDNKAEFDKLATMYDGNRQRIHDKMEYELKVIENYKKRRDGGNYATSNG